MSVSIGALLVRHVVVDGDRAGNDVGLGLVDGGGHFRGHERLVVVVERNAHAVFLESEILDVAVYSTFMDAKNDKFTAGPQNLGLKEDGVDYALDENNKDLITDEMKKAVEQAKADIISGKIEVHDYMEDNSCPY